MIRFIPHDTKGGVVVAIDDANEAAPRVEFAVTSDTAANEVAKSKAVATFAAHARHEKTGAEPVFQTDDSLFVAAAQEAVRRAAQLKAEAEAPKAEPKAPAVE